MKKILTGIQPTNDITLGNYLGAFLLINNYTIDNELFLFVADLHSITLGNFQKDKLEEYKKNIVKCFIASNLNIENVNIFYQSSIKDIPCLSHILLCNSTIGELTRMTQFKDKSQKQSNGSVKIPTGLLTYPILMAADILIYNADYVIVGSDQKQHLELTRDIAIRFNNLINEKVFNIPEFLSSKTTHRIMDLQNPLIKMSKSNKDTKGTIFLNDPINVSLNKIKIAKTDCFNVVKYDIENQPGISNLISIYSGLTNLSINEIEKKFTGKNYGEFKNEIMYELEKFLTNFQHKFNSISDEQIEKILNKGTTNAIKIANNNLKNIYKKIGFSYHE